MLTLYVNHFLQEIWTTPLLKCPKYFKWTESPEDADFLVLECPYEVIHDYSDSEYILYGIKPSDIKLLQNSFQVLKDISQRLNKRIIVFYYRDPFKPLRIPNAIIFRTSINKTDKEILTFAMPAFIPKSDEDYLVNNTKVRAKMTKPLVTFRGQHAPLKLPVSTKLRLLSNSLLEMIGISYRLQTYYPMGYIARRNAINSLQNNINIELDNIAVSWDDQKKDPEGYKKSYLDSLINSDYVICSSGYGNYSFRFYETLAAGRIPIFINTNAELPFENIIDWKSILVWGEYEESNYIDKKLLLFHKAIANEDFLKYQENMKKIYLNYLSMEGFCQNISNILLPLIL